MGQVSSCFGRSRRSSHCEAEHKPGCMEERAKHRQDEANRQDLHLEQGSAFLPQHIVLDTEIRQSNIQKDLEPELEMLTSICDLQNEMEKEFEEIINLQLFDLESSCPSVSAVMDEEKQSDFPRTTWKKNEKHRQKLELKQEMQTSIFDLQKEMETEFGELNNPQDLDVESLCLSVAAPEAILEPPAEDLVKIIKQQDFTRCLQASQSVEGDNRNDQEPSNENILGRLYQRWNKHREENRVKHKEKVRMKYQKRWEKFQKRLDTMNVQADQTMERFQIRRNVELKYQVQSSESPVEDQQPPAVLKHSEEERDERKEKVKKKYKKNWEHFEQRLEAMNEDADRNLAQEQRRKKIAH